MQQPTTVPAQSLKRYQRQLYGLGSDILLTYYGHDDTLFTALERQITAFEARFSRFRASSELSHINARAGIKTPISPEFLNLLKVAGQYNRLTNGLFNPCILPKLQAVGYVGSWPQIEQFESSLDFRARTSASFDEVRYTQRSILLPGDTALDFGGIGKGYLLDQLADFLEQQGITNFWLSLGGDIVLSGNNGNEKGWQVGIADASKLDTNGLYTTVQTDGLRYGLATSGTIKRRGSNWHHIIDPRSGLPSKTSVLTASLLSRSAVAADIYAKCLVIDPSLAGSLDRSLVSYWIQTDSARPVAQVKPIKPKRR